MTGKPTNERALIAWKGARLHIATEIYAGMIVNRGAYPRGKETRRAALEEAEALLLENEKMP